jgi:hypothetical protein
MTPHNVKETPVKKYMIAAAVAVLALTGCESDADKASANLSKAAEQFEVQRRIVGINGITDKLIFDVEGRCSIEKEDLGLVVICKHGPDDFRKHFVGLSDNVTYVATQADGIDVSVYRTRIIIKPENVIPNLDLVTGERG